MIPMILIFQIQTEQIKTFKIWLPLFLLWLILLPFVILLVPFLLIGTLATGTKPLKALILFWEILSALKGTQIEIKTLDQLIFFQIR